ncbi:MAG: HAMP domain-containing histidine kinase [Lachnospiraceae bacterium]|nr:HAMP domain-containing histidine kinase [Lachnospiraceae bacterium]
MIKNLRRKFIIIAMASIIVCTTLIVLFINLVNVYQMNQEVYDIVSEIADNNGYFPASSPPVDKDYPQSEQKMKEDEKKKPASDAPGIRRTREFERETSYFVVRFGKSGSESADISRVKSVSKETAIEYAKQVKDTEETNGFYKDYKFFVRTKGDGSVIVVFLDCESRIASLKKLALISVTVECAGVLLMFLFIWLFSGKAIRPVLESNEKQKQFITDASHELKTPLTVIATNMDVLSMDLPDNEWVEGTKKQVGNMRKLVNSMISLSRLEEESFKAEKADFDFSKAVEETISPFALAAEFEGKTFTFNIDSKMMMRGDESAIRQLVGILCDNAVKYACERGMIECEAKKRGKKVIIDISNDVENHMNREEMASLFDRFFRADSSRTKEGNRRGYGLGLAIAKAIVEKQGGKITASLDKDLRIHFTAELPGGV